MKQDWSICEVQFLIDNYRRLGREGVARALGRPKPSVAGYAGQLSLRRKKEPPWTEEDVNLLCELWGTRTIKAIARRLGRTECSILIKAKYLGLGATKNAFGRLTANQLASALGVDRNAVINWTVKCGLKCYRKATRSVYKFRLIDIDDFWRWAEKNQDKFDSRRFEPGALGREPSWMKQKREADWKLPKRRFQNWTPEEDAALRSMFKAGHLTYKEMAERLGRSEDAVGHRLARIVVWDAPGRKGA